MSIDLHNRPQLSLIFEANKFDKFELYSNPANLLQSDKIPFMRRYFEERFHQAGEHRMNISFRRVSEWDPLAYLTE